MRVVFFRLRVVLVLLFMAFPANAYESIEVEGGTTIRGRVRLEGSPPHVDVRKVVYDQQACGVAVPDESLVLGQEQEIRYAVVMLEGVTRGKAVEPKAYNVIDQHGCRFVPHVLVAVVGQWLLVANQDLVQHFPAAASLTTRSKLFDYSLAPSGRGVELLSKPGIFKVNCTGRHTWMDGYVVVTDHPYVAVTDAAGRYELRDVPPGRYVLKIWHERLGSIERSIEAQPGRRQPEDFAFRLPTEEVNATVPPPAHRSGG